MRTVRVFTCYDSFQAQIIQGALENEGITSVLHNIHTSDVLRGFEASFTEIDILVYEDDYEKARTLLKKNQMIPEDLKYCPYCHSDDIKLTVRNSKRIRALFSALLSMLAAAPPGTNHWEYVCNHCKKHFDVPTSKPD